MIDESSSSTTREEAARVTDTLGHLALAIIQAAAVIRQRICSLDGFCELFQKHKKELLESGRPKSEEESSSSVFTTWDISLHQIDIMVTEHSRFALELLRCFSFMHFDDIQESIFQRARQSIQEVQEIPILRDSALLSAMPTGWDRILWGKSISILVKFSLITVESSDRISMHPLVHEWSRSRMTVDDGARAWKTTVIILGLATYEDHTSTSQRHRRQLLPHIDAVMAYHGSQLYAQGPDLNDLSFAATKFMTNYAENLQYDKARRNHLMLFMYTLWDSTY